MNLYGYELKKLGRTQKGFLILGVCLLLKLLFLCFFPEQKDSRILLSQKQYDNYLSQLHGFNTQEKMDWIQADNQNIHWAIDNFEQMYQDSQQNLISDDEWQDYVDARDSACLRQNASEIFTEKMEQFSLQSWTLPPAQYIYEYGWRTVFALQKVPDIFLLFAVILMAAQCFPAEAAEGMLPILLSAKDGRWRLYRSKLLVLLAVTLTAAIVSGGMEAAVFALRGFMVDPKAPLYSITPFAEFPVYITLGKAYAICLGMRTVVAVLFAAMLFGLSIFIKNAANLIFTAICFLGLPLFLGNAGVFFHGGLLCGNQVLLAKGSSASLLPLGLLTAVLCSAVFVILGARRHQRGL